MLLWFSVEDRNRRGVFIVFEGIDGSGKSTQATMLSNYLMSKGYKVLQTEEPTRELITGFFVKIALKNKSRLPPEAYLLLFITDRLYHIENTLRPALSSGKIVISDRYHFSTLAYQTAQGIPRGRIDGLIDALGVKILQPDITIFVDTPVDEALRRLSGRERDVVDLFEKREFLERVRRNFLSLAEEFNFLRVDGSKDPLTIHKEIVKKIERLLPPP